MHKSKITIAGDYTAVDQGVGVFIEAALTYGGNVRINLSGERITLDKREAAALARFLTSYSGSER